MTNAERVDLLERVRRLIDERTGTLATIGQWFRRRGTVVVDERTNIALNAAACIFEMNEGPQPVSGLILNPHPWIIELDALIAELRAEGVGDHDWVLDTQTICPPPVRGEPRLFCKHCGVVKRRDGLNPPCKGMYRVTLRGDDDGE